MPLIPRRRKRAWDEQPTGTCEVLLAGDGRRRFSERAIAEATKQELTARHDWVGLAVDAIIAAGGETDGQVAVTRKGTKTIARIARTRGARTIITDETQHSGLRRFVEGDLGAELARKLRADGIEVVVIPYDPADPAS